MSKADGTGPSRLVEASEAAPRCPPRTLGKEGACLARRDCSPGSHCHLVVTPANCRPGDPSALQGGPRQGLAPRLSPGLAVFLVKGPAREDAASGHESTRFPLGSRSWWLWAQGESGIYGSQDPGGTFITGGLTGKRQTHRDTETEWLSICFGLGNKRTVNNATKPV